MQRTELAEKPLPLFAWLAMTRGTEVGRAMRLGEQTNIGRDTRNDFALGDSQSSAEHARIRVEANQFVLYDLGSLNGTMVNGKRVDRCILMDGDKIRIGETELTFKRI